MSSAGSVCWQNGRCYFAAVRLLCCCSGYWSRMVCFPLGLLVDFGASRLVYFWRGDIGSGTVLFWLVLAFLFWFLRFNVVAF
jgi:hypothetical protein